MPIVKVCQCDLCLRSAFMICVLRWCDFRQLHSRPGHMRDSWWKCIMACSGTFRTQKTAGKPLQTICMSCGCSHLGLKHFSTLTLDPVPLWNPGIRQLWASKRSQRFAQQFEPFFGVRWGSTWGIGWSCDEDGEASCETVFFFRKSIYGLKRDDMDDHFPARNQSKTCELLSRASPAEKLQRQLSATSFTGSPSPSHCGTPEAS